MSRLLRSVCSVGAPRWPWRKLPAPARHPRPHYIFRVTLTDANDESGGRDHVDLGFLQGGVTRVVLDLTSRKTKGHGPSPAVSSRGAALKFQHSADRLAITLDSLPRPASAANSR